MGSSGKEAHHSNFVPSYVPVWSVCQPQDFHHSPIAWLFADCLAGRDDALVQISASGANPFTGMSKDVCLESHSSYLVFAFFNYNKTIYPNMRYIRQLNTLYHIKLSYNSHHIFNMCEYIHSDSQARCL